MPIVGIVRSRVIIAATTDWFRRSGTTSLTTHCTTCPDFQSPTSALSVFIFCEEKSHLGINSIDLTARLLESIERPLMRNVLSHHPALGIVRTLSRNRPPSTLCITSPGTRSFTMTHKTQEPVITRLSELPTSEAKWVTLQKIEYVDQVGKAQYVVATRSDSP